MLSGKLDVPNDRAPNETVLHCHLQTQEKGERSPWEQDPGQGGGGEKGCIEHGKDVPYAGVEPHRVP